MSFSFETRDVQAPESHGWVTERLEQKRGGWLFGALGTGKSHTVRKAVQGGLWIDVSAGPLVGQRFAVDLARQAGAAGRSLLAAFQREGLEASLEVAERVVNGHPLIVDGVDRLLPAPSNLDDPAGALWQDERKALLDWLRGRIEHTPTLLVGRRYPQDVESRFSHVAPRDWPIRLVEAETGFRDWPRLGRCARGNPAVLSLARALVPLLPAAEFNTLVAQAAEEEVSVTALLQRLGQAFQASAPLSWQKVLAIVGALGEVPRDVFERLRGGVSSRAVNPERTVDERLDLERLRTLQLVEERAGVLSLLPALLDAGAIRALTATEREDVLPAAAHALLAPINDPRSLVPEQAERVLRAHAIFVELGDMSLAERTATLHVHGLVDLARRTSMEGEHRRSWPQYDGIFRMMQSSRWGIGDTAGRRLLSYVRHYRARDGALAQALDDATCLTEYRQAAIEWPDNALWHQRLIEALIRLGRPVEAGQAVAQAYQLVEAHPRRDELLRVRPAWTALRSGLPLLSLDLIEPVLDLPPDLFPEVADGGRRLLARWEGGLPLAELPFSMAPEGVEGRVVFHVPKMIELRRTAADRWVAQLQGLAFEGDSGRPRGSIEALARRLGDETRRLVSTPSSSLGEKDVRLKGRLLSLVDALNSDVGLEHAAERWIVGRIVDRALVPTMRHLPAVEVPDALIPESVEGLYFARVPVYRDGVPSGPATRIEPAGSGCGTDSLLELLARLSEEAA